MTYRPRACSVVIFEGDINVDFIGSGAVIGIRGTSSKRQKRNELVVFKGNITGKTLPKKTTIGRDNTDHASDDKTPFEKRGAPLEKSPKHTVDKLRKRVKTLTI